MIIRSLYWGKKFFYGFTILELLIVIAILSILTTIGLHTLSESRFKASAVQVLRQFQEIEDALSVTVYTQDLRSWPSGAFSVQELIKSKVPGLKDQIGNLPGAPYEGEYQYHNKKVYSCGLNTFNSGVNLKVHSDTAATEYFKIFIILDKAIDGGDGPECGRIKYGGPSKSLYYLIADDSYDI